MATLYTLSYSPWSEKARWGLDHHRLVYQERQHVPFLGELLLRWRARGTGAAVSSVPLYIDSERSLCDSYQILEHADAIGAGAPLARDPECRSINAICDEALGYARARVIARTVQSPKALDEASAVLSPALFAPLMRPIARYGARFLARKYNVEMLDIETLNRMLGERISMLEARLGDRRYLLDDFSAADICFAMMLQAVEPVRGEHLPLAPATRECWRAPALAQRFAHLIEWRDALYAEHR